MDNWDGSSCFVPFRLPYSRGFHLIQKNATKCMTNTPTDKHKMLEVSEQKSPLLW